MGRAVTFDHTGNVWEWNGTAASASPTLAAAGSMNGEWNAPATFNRTTFRRPSAGASASSQSRSSVAAGHDHLARRVDVGDRQPAPFGSAPGGNLLCLFQARPEQRRHARRLEIGGVGHGLAAFGDHRQRIVEVDRSRRGQGRVLPQRVTGRRRRQAREPRPDLLPQGVARAQTGPVERARCGSGSPPSPAGRPPPTTIRARGRPGGRADRARSANRSAPMPGNWLPCPGKRTANDTVRSTRSR